MNKMSDKHEKMAALVELICQQEYDQAAYHQQGVGMGSDYVFWETVQNTAKRILTKFQAASRNLAWFANCSSL